MEALQCYGSDSDSSDQELDRAEQKKAGGTKESVGNRLDGLLAGSQSANGDVLLLPPPPPDLLNTSNSARVLQVAEAYSGKIRSFPHVEGNFALHVYIPVPVSTAVKRHVEPLMKKAFSIAAELKPMEIDLLGPANEHTSQEPELAKKYHLSLSRTVPIRMHQIDSIVAMLQHKFGYQKGFWLELDQWEVFVNDEQTRSFLSLEVVGQGLSEICKQIQFVSEVFKLHKLQTYYEVPRPHVSIAWALGNTVPSLKKCVEELTSQKSSQSGRSFPLWSHPVNKIECKIGNRTYCIWKSKSQPKAPL